VSVAAMVSVKLADLWYLSESRRLKGRDTQLELLENYLAHKWSEVEPVKETNCIWTSATLLLLASAHYRLTSAKHEWAYLYSSKSVHYLCFCQAPLSPYKATTMALAAYRHVLRATRIAFQGESFDPVLCRN